MRVIVAGSRTIADQAVVDQAIEQSDFHVTELICGMARGVDRCGLFWAERNNIPTKLFPVQWDKYGRSAGHRRNAEMADHADALILVWDGKSKGSAGMKQIAQEKGLSIYEVVV